MRSISKIYKCISDSLVLFLIIAKNAKILTALRVVISLIGGLSLPLETILMSYLAATIDTQNNFGVETLVFIVIGIALVRATIGIFNAINTYLDRRIVFCTEKYIRKDFQNITSRFGYRWHEMKEFADMSENAMHAVEPMYSISIFGAVPEFISYSVSFICVISLIGSIKWYLAVIAIAMSILRVFISIRFTKVMNEMNNVGSQARLAASALKEAYMEPNIHAELRTFYKIGWMIEKWKNKYNLVNKNVYLINAKHSFFNCLLSVWDKLFTIIMIGLFVLIENDATSASAVLIISGYTSLEIALENIGTSFSAFSTYYYMIGNYVKLIKSPESRIRKPGGNNAKIKVEMKGVCFSYDMEKDILHNINLTINAGEKIAIVGENGSGKTTLAKIILQLYEPCKGNISIIDMNGLMPECRVSTVLQDYVKYQLSLRDNIALSDISKIKDDERIINAYRTVCNDEMSIALDDIIGKQFGKRDLSGGEWQRLAIARAYFREAPLIVLDEPNASIDAFAEAVIIKQMFDLSQNKTCIFITHRLTTTALADRIIVMKEGCIIEEGTHEKLMEKNGEYAHMYRLQAEMYA